MKTRLIFFLLTFAFAASCFKLKAETSENDQKFANWLKTYIPSQYSGVKIIDHHEWFQAEIPEQDLTVSWGKAPQESIELQKVEGLSEKKSIFIAKASDKWSSKLKYSKNVGYYIPKYKSSKIGDLDVGKLSIVQFDGKPKKFVAEMVKAYQKCDHQSHANFSTWLKAYVSKAYPALKIAYHGGWYQSQNILDNLTVTWGAMSCAPMPLKDLHGLQKDKTLFIEKQNSEGWEKLNNIEYIEGVGYKIAKYDESTMGNFEVGLKTVVQFDGDKVDEFTSSMMKAWKKLPKYKEKYRVITMSDFPPIGVQKSGDHLPNTMKSDPDDMQSMVRFLLYANEFDIEGIVVGAGTFAMTAHKKNMLEVLDRYDQVYDNLITYDTGYPTADYLRSVTFEGRANNHGLSIKWGCEKQDVWEIIGEGLDSEASEAIIAAVDKDDPRPLWIGVWGGAREVAQAIWKVKTTRSEYELEKFIGKLRIHLIYCQDATHKWLMDEFPELFIIESMKTYQGMFGGHDPKSDLAWVNEHIRNNHGPLCDIYPHEGMGCTGVCEGDTPAFLHLVSANRGINNPEDPTQSSWGGRFVQKEGTNHYVDGPGKSSISKWRAGYQQEFKELADRCIKPKLNTNRKKHIIR
ncbi:MAG TPA: DUF1593 domain-containing protein [Prolixibacteraceae bacterium]|nr:DUF1593 domain-containing protein [Prolixibacteraceae bacterium]